MNKRAISGAIVVALFAVVAGVYAATFSFRGITDTELNSLQTRSFVLHGDIDLTRYGIDLDAFQGPGGNLVVERDGHQYSVYGLGISLVAAPIYAVLVRLGASEHLLQATTAIAFAAAAAAALGVLLLRLVPRWIAVGCLVVFAFGTTLWPVAAMALFQQAPVLFFESVALLGLFSRRPSGPALAGAGFGMAALVRPTAAIPLVVVGFLYLGRGRRQLGAYLAGAVLPLVAVAVQNRWIWGSWINGGSERGLSFNGPFGAAFGGLTVGWWRGVFAYSPILIVGVAGWLLAMRRSARQLERTLIFLGVSAFATIILYSKWPDWGGGINQFGYRLQLEVVPFLVVLAAYAMTRAGKLIPYAALAGVLSVLTMTWGAAPRRDGFDNTLFAHEIRTTSLYRSWSNFFDHPIDGIMRLVLVAVACALIGAIAHRLWSVDRAPAFAAVEAGS